MKKNYDDIINLPRPVSERHVPMSVEDRAAQFSPFAALTGHDAAIRETARRTNRRIELSDDARASLDEKLSVLIQRIDERPCVAVTYFVRDKLKAGGAYMTVKACVKKLDEHGRTLVMTDKTSISIDDIFNLEGDIFDLV